MNGFMIQVGIAGTGSVTIPAVSRAHGAGNWYKSTSGYQRIALTAEDIQGGTSKKALIEFREGAREGIDPTDTYYLGGFAPAFYSLAGKERLSLNALPSVANDLIVPLGFRKNEGSQFRIKLSESIPGTTPYLIDRKLNREHRLTFDSPYLFASEAGDDPQRFELWFTSAGLEDPTSVDSPATATMARIYAYDNMLTVHFHEPAPGRHIEVFDLSGRRIMHQHIGETTMQHQQQLSLQAGVYLVRMSDKNQLQTEKIVVTR